MKKFWKENWTGFIGFTMMGLLVSGVIIYLTITIGWFILVALGGAIYLATMIAFIKAWMERDEDNFWRGK